MSSPILCCNAIEPFRPRRLDHEAKFTAFMTWAEYPRHAGTAESRPGLESAFAIQLVRQVNYGPIDWKKYFIPSKSNSDEFIQVVEDDLIQANFQKVNTYKNFRCGVHNKFFEVNVYQKDPVNKHHWRANLARPARDIDLGDVRSNSDSTATSEGMKRDGESSVTSASASTVTGYTGRYQQPTVDSGGLLPSGYVGNLWSAAERDDSPDKDFTACDKECGYCGRCDY